MPSWTAKEERQYEHIKESARKRGQSGRAKEIAARTVNKQRREEGRTAQPAAKGKSTARSSSKGSSSRQELYDRAKKLGIEGRSKMNKGELERAIQKKR